MRADRVTEGLTAILEEGIAAGVAPGMACAIGDEERAWFVESGRHTYSKDAKKVDDRTVWDVASVTKVAATTSVAMALYQQHVLDLDSHVQSIVAEFIGEGKEEVTVRNLLLHDSGLPAYRDLKKFTDAKKAKGEVLKSALEQAPCEKTTYSCLGFITLMEVMQRLTGTGMDELLKRHVTGPLAMSDTLYSPSFEDRTRCAPTEKYEDWRKAVEDERGFKRVNGTYIQGAVHDPIAFLVGGVSGNAGLFSTARDLAKLARAWLTSSSREGRGPIGSSRGASPAPAPFAPEVVTLFATKQEEKSTRALGFDTKSPEGSSAGTKFSMKSFGHTGYTGTTIWVDPESRIFAVLLTNRVHPTAANTKITYFRPKFHDAVFDLLAGA